MLETLGIVATFLTLGSALDLIISDSAKRKMFESPQPQIGFKGDLNSSRIQRVVSATLSGLLTDWSLKNTFVLSALVSIGVFSLVTAYQIYFLNIPVFSTILEGSDGFLQSVLYLALLFTGVLFVDFVSFAESRILIGILPRCRNAAEVIVVLLSELLLTIWIYSILFALCLTAMC